MTYPEITPTIIDYNPTGTAYEANVVNNVAPCERLRICLSIDKAAYDAAIIANGSVGTFDINFRGVNHRVVNQLPASSQNILTTPSTVVENNDSTLKVQEDFRISDSYAGQTFYVLFELIFREAGVFHNMRYFITVNVASFTNDINLLTATQGSNDANQVICMDDPTEVCLQFEEIPDTFFIPYVHALTIEEQNNFDSPDLNRLDSPTVISFDNNKLVLDSSLMKEGELCIKVVAKPTGEMNPTEPDCDPITLEVNTTTLVCINGLASILIFYNIQGLNSADIQSVSITIGGSNQMLTSSTGQMNFQINEGTSTIEIMITTVEGCVYSHSYTYTTDCDNNLPITTTVTLTA